MRGSRLFAMAMVGLLASVLPGPAAAQSAAVSGTVGETIDGAANFGQFYLRHVGDPAPAGYSHDYQWATPVVLSTNPEDAPVVISGTLDLSARVPGTTAGLGLLDIDGLAAGSNGFFSGAHIYLSTRANGDLRIGVADGNVGGEIVQRFVDLPSGAVPASIGVTFTIDGTADPATCASHAADVASADGCMVLAFDSTTITDSYGTLGMAGGNATEFSNGGIFGWEAFEDGTAPEFTGIGYDLVVDPVVINDPQTKDDCKNGGWEQYGFSNQGQCIRFVNTGKDSR